MHANQLQHGCLKLNACLDTANGTHESNSFSSKAAPRNKTPQNTTKHVTTKPNTGTRRSLSPETRTLMAPSSSPVARVVSESASIRLIAAACAFSRRATFWPVIASVHKIERSAEQLSSSRPPSMKRSARQESVWAAEQGMNLASFLLGTRF